MRANLNSEICLKNGPSFRKQRVQACVARTHNRGLVRSLIGLFTRNSWDFQSGVWAPCRQHASTRMTCGDNMVLKTQVSAFAGGQ